MSIGDEITYSLIAVAVLFLGGGGLWVINQFINAGASTQNAKDEAQKRKDADAQADQALKEAQQFSNFPLSSDDAADRLRQRAAAKPANKT